MGGLVTLGGMVALDWAGWTARPLVCTLALALLTGADVVMVLAGTSSSSSGGRGTMMMVVAAAGLWLLAVVVGAVRARVAGRRTCNGLWGEFPGPV
jgi:hypothetical protein